MSLTCATTLLSRLKLGAGSQIRIDTYWVEANRARPLNTTPAIICMGFVNALNLYSLA